MRASSSPLHPCRTPIPTPVALHCQAVANLTRCTDPSLLLSQATNSTLWLVQKNKHMSIKDMYLKLRPHQHDQSMAAGNDCILLMNVKVVELQGTCSEMEILTGMKAVGFSQRSASWCRV